MIQKIDHAATCKSRMCLCAPTVRMRALILERQTTKGRLHQEMLCDNFRQTHVLNLARLQDETYFRIALGKTKTVSACRHFNIHRLIKISEEFWWLQPTAILLNGRLCSLFCLDLFISFPNAGRRSRLHR
jgi:hypothetical protein